MRNRLLLCVPPYDYDATNQIEMIDSLLLFGGGAIFGLVIAVCLVDYMLLGSFRR